MFEFYVDNFIAGVSEIKLYIDPATTSYVVQIIAGVVIAVGTTAGIMWNKLRRKFKKTSEENETAVRTEKKGQGGVVTADDLMSDDDDK